MITDDFDYLAPGGRSYTTTSGLIAKLGKRSRVLEIASGRGEAACALAGTFHCKVDAFDMDPIMVEYSREKAKELGLEDFVDFDVKDGREMDFGEGQVRYDPGGGRRSHIYRARRRHNEVCGAAKRRPLPGTYGSYLSQG